WKTHFKHVGGWVSHLHGRIISPSLKLPLTESLKRRLNVLLVGCKIIIGMCAHECLHLCPTLHSLLIPESPMYGEASEKRTFFLGRNPDRGVINGILFGCVGRSTLPRLLTCERGYVDFALGQTRTSADVCDTTASPSEADMTGPRCDVAKVP